MPIGSGKRRDQSATAIGEGLGLPVESRPAEHFGWFALFAGMDSPVSSHWTRSELGWQPGGVGLLEDLREGHYFLGLDFTEPYLRTALGFMGMTEVETVRAEGVKLPGNREKAIEAALTRVPVAVAV